MIKQILNKIKNHFSTIIAIVVVLIVIIPWFFVYLYLKKQGKTIVISPKFEIKEIKNTDNVDSKMLGDVIKIGEQIFNRIKTK